MPLFLLLSLLSLIFSSHTLAQGPATNPILPAHKVVGSSQGLVETSDQRVRLYILRQTLPEGTLVIVEPPAEVQETKPPPGYAWGETRFQVNAVSREGSLLTELERPVTVYVRYTKGELEAAGGKPSHMTLAYLDESVSQWRPLETRWHEEEEAISTATRHWSSWALLIEVGGPIWWIPVTIIGSLLIVAGVLYGSYSLRRYLLNQLREYWSGAGRPPWLRR